MNANDKTQQRLQNVKFEFNGIDNNELDLLREAVKSVLDEQRNTQKLKKGKQSRMSKIKKRRVNLKKAEGKEENEPCKKKQN